MPMETFQERITALFHEAKNANYRLNQQDFAVRFGASRSQLKGWLSGAGAPSTSMLRTIAKECNVSADWLIGGTDIRTPIDEVVKKIGQNRDKLEKLNNMPDAVDEEIAQEENMNSLSPEELRLLEQYRLADEQQKDILQKLTEMMVSIRTKK